MYLINKRRNIIGTGIDMAVRASELLEAPNGKRDLTRRALASGFKTDPKTFTNLCSDPQDGLYMAELFQLCDLIDIPIMKGSTKSEIISRLKERVKDATSCNFNLPKDISIGDAGRLLYRLINKRSLSSTQNYIVLRDGSILCWNKYNNMHSVPLLDGHFIAVSGTTRNTLALADDGKVVNWVFSSPIDIVAPKSEKRFISISANDNHLMVLTEDGEILAWGYNNYGECNVPKLCGFMDISAGYCHSLGLMVDGTVHVWGSNHRMQQHNVPESDLRFIAISAGAYHSLALTKDGKVLVWGNNEYGQCDIGDGQLSSGRFIAISAGNWHSMALRDDGTILTWGDGHRSPKSKKRFIAISALEVNSMALAEDGTVLVWDKYGNRIFKLE